MNRPLGRLGAAATLRQHCRQMTQIRCRSIKCGQSSSFIFRLISRSLRIDTEDLSDVTSVSSIDTWTTTGSMISGLHDFPFFKDVIPSNCILPRFGTAPAAEPCQRPDHPEGVPRGQRGGGVPLRLLRQILHQPPPPLLAHGTDCQ